MDPGKDGRIRRDDSIVADSKGSAVEVHFGAAGGVILVSSVARIHASMLLRKLRIR